MAQNHYPLDINNLLINLLLHFPAPFRLVEFKGLLDGVLQINVARINNCAY
jgi:hypothetical protein